MKLIIVNRSKPEVLAKLKKQFEDEIGVEVLFERRTRQRRRNLQNTGPERRSRERRQLVKPFNGKDYIVIYISG
jgi:exonuclease I